MLEMHTLGPGYFETDHLLYYTKQTQPGDTTGHSSSLHKKDGWSHCDTITAQAQANTCETCNKSLQTLKKPV